MKNKDNKDDQEKSGDDDELLTLQLKLAYQKSHPSADEGDLGRMDQSSNIASEVMRLRLMDHPQLVQKEFDAAVKIPVVIPSFPSIHPDQYAKEVDLIQGLSPEQRNSLRHKFVEWNAIARRKLFLRELSQGQRSIAEEEAQATADLEKCRLECPEWLYGFAIDPVTLETEVTSAFGDHTFARTRLACRLWVQGKVGGEEKEKNPLALKRLVSGVIVTGFGGFVTPILLVIVGADLSNAMVRRVMAVLRRQRRFIPVNMSWEYLGQDSTEER